MPLKLLQPDRRARMKPCLRCGYSLRHNIDARNCPECGLAVRVSLRDGDALDWSHPAWLRRIALATLLLALGHVGLLAALVGLLLARYIDVGPPNLFFWTLQAAGFAATGCVVLLTIGALLLSKAEGRYPDRTRGRRMALRVLAPVAAVLASLDVLPAQIRAPFIPLLKVLAWLSPAVAIAVTAVTWWTLHDAVRRVPARRCAGLATLLGAGVAIGGPLLLLSMRPRLFILLLVAAWHPRYAPLTIACLVYLPVALGVLVYCGVQFRSAAREADRNWVTDP